MLQYLHVKNLALIDEIEVEFKNGLNILTGETGAGKSIILGSVNLALGAKYSVDLLRNKDESGFVELGFYVEEADLEKKLNELDVYLEDHMAVLSRKLMSGRSVSRINGETVSTKILKEAAGILIDIHGQHEHQTLLKKKNHLALLDDYADEKVRQIKEDVCELYKEYQYYKKQLEESCLDEQSRLREISLAEFEIKEIEEASLLPDEDVELENVYQRMTEGKRYSESIAQTYQYTSEDQERNAAELLSRAIHSLQGISGCDKEGDSLVNQLMEIDSLLNDFNRDLLDYAKSFEFSAEEYYETENRLNLINHLKAKYGNSISQIQEYLKQRQERLSELTDYTNHVHMLEKKTCECEMELKKYSEKLSELRKKAAVSFEKDITQALKDLNFLDVVFSISFEKMDHYTANGTDDAEFYISTNPGEKPRPLAEIASGGELSRIMLAIKSVLADKDDTPTLIFDEIDSGISGITAGKVAEKMKAIAKNRQIICITHLPQIAAMSDSHYMIEKRTDHNKTKTQILCLDEKQSVRELARLLGGANITETILDSAKEMKDMAKREI